MDPIRPTKGYQTLYLVHLDRYIWVFSYNMSGAHLLLYSPHTHTHTIFNILNENSPQQGQQREVND